MAMRDISNDVYIQHDELMIDYQHP